MTPGDERCPTCGETGPDVVDRVGDYGGDAFEARCGDEWHDTPSPGDERTAEGWTSAEYELFEMMSVSQLPGEPSPEAIEAAACRIAGEFGYDATDTEELFYTPDYWQRLATEALRAAYAAEREK